MGDVGRAMAVLGATIFIATTAAVTTTPSSQPPNMHDHVAVRDVCGAGIRSHAPQDRFDLSSSGRYLVAQLPDRWMNELAVFDLDTEDSWIIRHPDPNVRLAHADFSPDEDRIVFSVSPSPHGVGDIWITDLRGNVQTVIGDYGRVYSYPEFDRTGQRLAYYRDVERHLENGTHDYDQLANRNFIARSIFVRDLDTGEEVQVDPLAAAGLELFWSSETSFLTAIASFYRPGSVNGQKTWLFDGDFNRWLDQNFDNALYFRVDFDDRQRTGRASVPELRTRMPASAPTFGRYEDRQDIPWVGPVPFSGDLPASDAGSVRILDVVQDGALLASRQMYSDNPDFRDDLYVITAQGRELIDWGELATNSSRPGSIDVYFARMSDDANIIAARQVHPIDLSRGEFFVEFHILDRTVQPGHVATFRTSDADDSYLCNILEPPRG